MRCSYANARNLLFGFLRVFILEYAFAHPVHFWQLTDTVNFITQEQRVQRYRIGESRTSERNICDGKQPGKRGGTE